jgi:SAM-dependent methyltransferase
MRRSIKRHVLADPLLCARPSLEILDVGGADVNGSYRTLFGFTEHRYVSADADPESGADVVLDGSCALPFADESFDVVVSGQTFEHVGHFWKLFAEMVRVCRPDGVVIVVAPSAGPVHRYPVDCYRFLPDSYQALANENRVLLVEQRVDPRGPFHDFTGVFRKQPAPPEVASFDATSYVDAIDGALQNESPDIEISDVEFGSGSMPALQFLRQLHGILEPRFYLEIGVREGWSIQRASCPAIGIDPFPSEFELKAEHALYRCLSTDFFNDDVAVDRLGPLDLVYIDGMHLIENVYDDFVNVERHSHSCSVILVDDIFPNHPVQARRDRSSRHWTGDVWKFVSVLKSARPDLILLPVDTSPTGTLLVLGAEPNDDTLREAFDWAVGGLIAMDPEPPRDVIERRDAVAPDDPLLIKVMHMVRELRDHEDCRAGMAQIRTLVGGAFPRKVTGGVE